jgi:uncharacterized protein YndB with AHSA1/START domain
MNAIDLPTPGVVDLTFRRLLKAPRATVWAAWADPARFAAWFGPHGATMEPCELDVRPGGRIFFCHRHPEFGDVWVRGEYVAVEAPRRLVLAFGFAAPDGSPAPRDGFAEESRVEVILDEAEGGTAMTIRHTGLARDQGETEGWRQGLERLDALLAAGTGEHP